MVQVIHNATLWEPGIAVSTLRVSFLFILISSAVTVFTGAGCASRERLPAYRTLPEYSRRDPVSAMHCNDRGLESVAEGEYDKAEQRFREALEHDVYCAAAHNNLGLTLLKGQRHYEAAWEFQYAAKLQPRASEPRGNLGLLYEALGRVGQAIEEYETALEIDPGNVETMRYLARAYVKAGDKSDKSRNLLERLLLIAHEPQWDHWLRGQVIRLGRKTLEPDMGMTPVDSKPQ